MNREDAIKKIRKCMAMAAGATGAEAAAALRQAQALMRDHQVNEEGVAQSSVMEVNAKAVLKPIVSWEAALVLLIADAFGCHVISTHKLTAMRLVRQWRLIGVDAAPEVAAYAFEVLAGQCTKARRAHMAEQSKNCKPRTRTARGDAFAAGWVRAVEALIERFANGAQHAEVVKAYVAKNYPSLASASIKRREEGRNVKDSAWHGRQAGKRATLHHGMGGLEERAQIGYDCDRGTA